ncbi:MAG TPA: hypothetical protein QGF58_25465 [Myxococcota bacterium]|nr:hypothetical protein [Myxococcota bacterium]
MRRFALLFGASAIATTLTLATVFGGLGLGGLLGGRLPAHRPNRTYALLEVSAALWALALPFGLVALTPLVQRADSLLVDALVVALLAGPPAVALGATLPVLARGFRSRATVAGLYAANTAGAVIGALAVPALLLPLFGVTGSERLVAISGIAVAVVAGLSGLQRRERAVDRVLRADALLAVAAAGFSAMVLEVAWTRLGAVLLGPSIHALAWVLAAFLGGIAVGAALGRRRGRLDHALGAMALCALAGTFVYAQAPLMFASLYDRLGPEGLWLASVGLAVLTMAGAPIASGFVFARALEQGEVGALYGANTLLGVVGAALAGLVLVPALGVQGTVVVAAVVVALAASVVGRRPWWILAAVALAALMPDWDARLYAVGIYSRVSDLGDRSREGIRSFAQEGWDLLFYEDGRTAAVAVGQSTTTGTIWLSINGKVDASTGDDMPTQVLSGQIPLRMHGAARDVLVVGLASGVTAGAVLDEGVESLVIVELEPRVVEASHYFDDYSGAPLSDERTRLRVDDARAVLSEPQTFDVIISEPSNPWITGVSNLFTLEYWELGRSRLREGGVFCQWIQLYGLGTRELLSVVATFVEVFPQTWLYEPLEGGDVLLVGALGEVLLDDLDPVLGPDGVQRLAGGARLNTDEHPWVELEAPRAMHLATVVANKEAIRRVSGRQ